MKCKFKDCNNTAEYGVDQIGTEYELFTKTGLSTVCKDHFHDAFWLEEIAQGNGVVVEGKHYRISKSDSRIKGFGGRKWTIKFHNGTTVETDNLWTQGEIPEKYRTRLPDNAVFV